MRRLGLQRLWAEGPRCVSLRTARFGKRVLARVFFIANLLLLGTGQRSQNATRSSISGSVNASGRIGLHEFPLLICVARDP